MWAPPRYFTSLLEVNFHDLVEEKAEFFEIVL